MAYVSYFTFLGTFSLSVFSYLLPLFCHFTAFLFRLRKGDGSSEKSFDFSEAEVDGRGFAESKRESGKAENKSQKSQKDFDFSDEVLFQSEKEKEWLVTDSDSASSTGFEHMSRLGDSLGDGFLSDEDFEIDSFRTRLVRGKYFKGSGIEIPWKINY